MASTGNDAEAGGKKPSKMPLVLGLVLGLAGAGAGFYATFSGLILGSSTDAQHASQRSSGAHGKGHVGTGDAYADIAFVEVDPITVTLPGKGKQSHLHFRASLEVPAAAEAGVKRLMPRVLDVLNGYLRAVRPEDLEGPAILTELRAHMLHRVKMVVGEEQVNDLLVMEFVIN